MKKMGDSRIRIRNLWLPFRGEIPRISNIQDTNASADTKSARHGQNQEKKRNSDYWIEYFPFEIFSTEIRKCSTSQVNSK